jgi:phage protein D
VKDSDIAGRLASGAGLTADATDTGVTLDYVLQNNLTDLEFLQERAGRIGYEVVVQERTLYFRPRRHTQAATLTLTVGADLLRFAPRLTTLTQVGEVAVRAWSPQDKAGWLGQAGAGSEVTTMGGSTRGPAATNRAFGEASRPVVDRPVSSQAEADEVARGLFNEMALAYVTGEATCDGRTDLRAGNVVEIAGAGERFSGFYYVTSAMHLYSAASGYQTTFTFRRNAT